jgi:hypothetical protein
MPIAAVTRTYTQDSIPRQRATSTGAVTSNVLRNAPGFVNSFYVTNNTATAGFLQFFDATALPANGTVPLVVIPLPASETIGSDIPIFGLVGMVAAISTTQATLTISANAAFFYANTSG